ncbi:Serine/threonine-protein kinase PknB [Thalassoglobus neptunius]|uniref:non-specific serine/threonine protein kinase n=1 Tax=Thalassoglobus neptunius TaxID=1938619 RepID=A0A5C5WXZ6_9PLAN|nr:serine/threonine-protein kinase [Thalassoglobus neptunius]TWT55478.1 Serine/threonine-protein kinase PknB [Thalassoglobus neptunius]
MAEESGQERILTKRSDSGPIEKSRSKSAWSWAGQIVDGTGANFSKEVNTVLEGRLKAASLIFFVGYSAFFLKTELLGSAHITEADALLRWTQLVAIVSSGLIAWRTCAGCGHVNRNLRIAELILFGTSELYFIVLTYSMVLDCATRGYLFPIVAPWMILLFTYSLFIPNSWQRALAMMLPMAIAPVAVMGIAGFAVPVVAAEFAQPENSTVLIEAVMVMTFSLVIATWGVRTIRSLRTAEFEARQLGLYRLKRLLGRGGMGEVHLAEHLLLKRPCAIKLIRPEMAGDPQTLARFEREVRSTAQLTHWNTVEIYDYGVSEDGTFYYVMEYLPGMNLDQIVTMHGPMPDERLIHFFEQTCDALAEAHEQGLVHRDIKPANIFAAKRGGTYDVAKLLDFGLVRSEHVDVDTKITQEGRIAGSPMYMAPEQASGDVSDARADIYALGCVAYYVLTGKTPFQEANAVKLLLAHAQQTPVSLRSHNPNVSEELDAIVLKCLEKNPDDRFQSVEELREALKSVPVTETWTRERAQEWWTCHGCPKKRELDECIQEGREPPSYVADSTDNYAETKLLAGV